MQSDIILKPWWRFKNYYPTFKIREEKKNDRPKEKKNTSCCKLRGHETKSDANCIYMKDKWFSGEIAGI